MVGEGFEDRNIVENQKSIIVSETFEHKLAGKEQMDINTKKDEFIMRKDSNDSGIVSDDNDDNDDNDNYDNNNDMITSDSYY